MRIATEKDFQAPSLQICDRAQCVEAKAKGWNSIANTQGTPRPTRAGYCSWCWSDIKVGA
jgi:hypothetical protein